MSRSLLPRQLPHHRVRFGRLHPRLVVVAAVLGITIFPALLSAKENS